MKLIISDNRIAATATDAYVGPDRFIDAPEDFDESRLEEYIFDGETVVIPDPPPPTSVTARQGYIYMHREGLLEHIEAYINNLPEPVQTEARIEWEKTAVIERDNPLLAEIAEMMQWDDERLDEMFMEASKL